MLNFLKRKARIVKDAVAAADWIANALSSSGYRADFSIESVKEVDRFLEDQAPDGIPIPNGLLANNLGAKLFALGSYTGEVIRRHIGGEWKGEDSDPQAEINIAMQLTNGTICWPVQRIIKRFKNGTEDGVYAYVAALTASAIDNNP